ncbi:type III secretion system effector protein [Paenibacillus periandrae]|uniref:type III secretion system effector protein n=1 Tax=Paenibacillus periandrae TaxID=1761741 RepID=UPI001F09E0C3|nr:type III secretion system effector protein [Paenibacillus periandrae]
MSDLHKNKCNELRDQLHQLIHGSDDFVQGVRSALDALEREPIMLDNMEKLSQENRRLKQEIVRLRDILHSKDEGSMSSKLRDALRE